MSTTTMIFPMEKLLQMGFSEATNVHYQLSSEELVEQTISRQQGKLNNTGALVIKTGEFTGRSPLDKFIVKDEETTANRKLE